MADISSFPFELVLNCENVPLKGVTRPIKDDFSKVEFYARREYYEGPRNKGIPRYGREFVLRMNMEYLHRDKYLGFFYMHVPPNDGKASFKHCLRKLKIRIKDRQLLVDD